MHSIVSRELQTMGFPFAFLLHIKVSLKSNEKQIMSNIPLQNISLLQTSPIFLRD